MRLGPLHAVLGRFIYSFFLTNKLCFCSVFWYSCILFTFEITNMSEKLKCVLYIMSFEVLLTLMVVN